MLFKLSNLNSNLALTLGYLNPALNNSAQVNYIYRLPNKAIFKVYQIALSGVQNSHQKGLLFTHKNGDLAVITAIDQSCAM